MRYTIFIQMFKLFKICLFFGNIKTAIAKENGKVMSKGESLSMVNDIIKNVRLDPTTNMPSFKFGTRKIDPLNE